MRNPQPDHARRLLLLGAPLATAAFIDGCARSASPPADGVVHGQHGITENTSGLTPDEALFKLVEGNDRFVSMAEVDPNVSETRLMAVAGGQQPFVGVLGCVDSRVPPELIFDRGLGDVFDARIAGAIADDAAIGSLEFGVEEFGVPLLVVLGHSRCGAVTAAVKAMESSSPLLPGRISSVVDPILPAVKTVRTQGVADAEVVNAAAREVVHRGVDALSASPILDERIRDGRLRIVGAFYDLDIGRVDFFR
jgi:carbonic anhydrase